MKINLSEPLNFKIQRNMATGRFEIDLTRLNEENLEVYEELIKEPQVILSKILADNETIINGQEVSIMNVPRSLIKPISDIRSKNLGELTLLSGILKKVSQPTKFTHKINFECPSCGTILHVMQNKNKIREPTRCSCGRRGGFTILSEEKIDIQEMELEENAEDIGSRQPSKIKLLLQGKLTDPSFIRFQVGNKVEVLGIVEDMPLYILKKDIKETIVDNIFRVIEIYAKEGLQEEILLSEEEIESIKEIAYNNPLQTLAQDIAPNLYGMEHLKRASILFLAKGVTEIVNGERKRGEIHTLIVGDPGLAKSTLMDSIKEKGMNFRISDGKNASRAGIIASVNKDKTSGQFEIEAGDMVLANGGYLGLDEAEKLSAEDIKGLHRPMEHGEAVISKAGVKAKLKTETSIFAVANPRAGMFDVNVPIISQLEFTPTFLSRFDLIFILRDNPDIDIDREKARRILDARRGKVDEKFSPEFFRKYFSYISKIKPVLTEEAANQLEKVYTHLRGLSEDNGIWKGIPINSRQLEGLLRLSEAHAKIRLSDKVEPQDVDVAEDLFKRSLSDFGINIETGVMDLASITTSIKSSKKARYYKVLEVLKEKAKLKNEFIRKEIYPVIQAQLGISYGEVSEVFDMLHNEHEIIETDNYSKIKLVNVD